MKTCLSCNNGFEHETWTCPSCLWTPPTIDGFPAFAPELAHDNDGLPSDAHHSLARLQQNSFWFRVRNQLISDAISRFFPTANSVLEIGCGSGFVLNQLRATLPKAKLTGTEIYTNGLMYSAKSISGECDYLQVDARKLPYNNEFCLIGAFDVLEHIEEDILVLENIRRSLKKGGGVIFTVPQHPSLWSKVDEAACHKRRYKRKELRNALEELNFEILLNTSFMFFLLPAMIAQRYLGSKNKDFDPSTELVLPKFLDKSFELILKLERRLINLGIRFPVGGSRLIVARLKA